MIKTSFTWYFEEVFSSYEEWTNFIINKGIVDYSKPAEMALDEHLFTLLYRHFNHCNIRYDNVDAFKSELLIVYENKFYQYKQKLEIINTIYQLPVDELSVITEGLTNIANSPNDNVTNPRKLLNYISAQTFSTQTKNKLQAYVESIYNIPDKNIYKFLTADNPNDMGFDDLFMNVQPNIIYCEGE